MAEVTFVPAFVVSPCGVIVISAVWWASNGLRKSILKTTLDGDASVISIRPLPMFLLPSHSYTAPLPLAAPLYVRFIEGSFFSQGDQAPWLRKSLTNGRIFSGAAL